MKICIIGNSHVACVKRAWDAHPLRENDALEIDFFAGRGKSLGHMAVEDRMLVPRKEALRESIRFTSGGQEAIDPSRYDLVLLCGLSVDPLNPGEGVYSEACLRDAMQDHFAPMLGTGIARLLRPLTRARVLIMHTPLRPLPAGMDADAAGAPGDDPYVAAIDRANDLLFRAEGLELLAQPPETRVPGHAFFTRRAFARGSRRLAVGKQNDGAAHGADDEKHMNDAFGRIALDDVLARVGVTVPTG